LRLIAPLSLQDAGGELSLPSPSALSPLFHLARVTPDGAVAVFVSRGALTGADNVDSESGNADAEVFRYEASGNELRCLSCSPAGEAPRGGVLEPRQVAGPSYWYASRIPGWELQLHAPRVISAGGDRVFFDSLNRLVAADENEAEDVYEWEAPGTGTCSEASPDYNPEAGGCLSLLSSGSDERGSEFVDASAAGRDVFLLSGQSLVGWDPGQFDLYDAREGGGLPAPPVSRGPECEGEGCQPQSTPPPPAGNSSEASLPGNPTFKRPCKKGFARRHGKCVKKQQKKHEKRHHKRKARR
jgi:hypothetical protein